MLRPAHLLVLLALPAPAAAVQGPSFAATDPGAAPLELPEGSPALRLWAVSSWEERLERDASLMLSRSAAEEAVRRVDVLSGIQAAAALYAIGAGGQHTGRNLLRERVAAEDPLERQGAILGLAVLGPGDEGLFDTLLEDADRHVAQVAALALALTDSPAGRAALEQRIQRGAEPQASWAREALFFQRDPAGSETFFAADRLLELRWLAARRFGYVAGTRWATMLVESLCHSEEFLDAVVLGEAAGLPFPGVRDHLLQQLLEVGGRACTQAVARAMQPELARVIRHGLWVPTRPAEWAVVFEEIERGRAQADIVELLRLAAEIPQYRGRAVLLLVASGDKQAARTVPGFLQSQDPEDRAAACRALGGSGDPRWIAELSRARLDPEPAVVAEALIAQVRLRHGPGLDRVRDLLRTDVGRERDLVVDTLVELSYDVSLLPLLNEAHALAQAPDSLRLATCLVEQGVLGPRDEVREAFAAGLGGPLTAAMVRGLARGADQRDRKLFQHSFPAEGSLELNIELARALLRNRDVTALPVLRAAMWSSPWHRSVLASALLVSMRGPHGLMEELDAPPRGVGANALRRVGFALGELGGFEEVEHLSRRRRSGDPDLQGCFLGALSARTH